jgi:hypothetical protein
MGNKLDSNVFHYSDSHLFKTDIPLSLMDTKANRRLAVALRAAAEAADVVAAERGLTGDQSLSGLLDMFARSVELECYGAEGLDGR